MPDFDTPIQFEPILKAKTWGGRKLATRLGRKLPTDGLFGESWEICGLPGNVSRARGGRHDGQMLSALIDSAAHALLGGAANVDSNTFPLLIKYLDAKEALSVQAHPRPPAVDVKDEAWYIVDADEGAVVYIGLKPGIDLKSLQAAAQRGDDPATYLNTYPTRPGDCFCLPSGVVHALGGGILVAEVQTPSDTTYRLYDWGRLDQGTNQPRELHVDQVLANVRDDVVETDIVQPRQTIEADGLLKTRICANSRFTINEVRIDQERTTLPLSPDVFQILMVVGLDGERATFGHGNTPLRFGDVFLVPAACKETTIATEGSAKLLLVQPVV